MRHGGTRREPRRQHRRCHARLGSAGCTRPARVGGPGCARCLRYATAYFVRGHQTPFSSTFPKFGNICRAWSVDTSMFSTTVNGCPSDKFGNAVQINSNASSKLSAVTPHPRFIG
jgi:hypothetical protein